MTPAERAELMNAYADKVEAVLTADLLALSEIIESWLQAERPSAELDRAALINLIASLRATRRDLESCGEQIKERVRRQHGARFRAYADAEIHHRGYDHIDGG